MVFSSPLSFVSRTKGIDVDQSVPDLAIKFGGLIVTEFPRAIFHNKDIRDDAIGMDGLVLVQGKLIMTRFWLQRAISIQYSLTQREDRIWLCFTSDAVTVEAHQGSVSEKSALLSRPNTQQVSTAGGSFTPPISLLMAVRDCHLNVLLQATIDMYTAGIIRILIHKDSVITQKQIFLKQKVKRRFDSKKHKSKIRF